MIESYADLQLEIPDSVGNDKVSGERAKTCIQLAESRIRNDILIRRMELPKHGYFDGAVIFLPEDCESIQRLMFYTGDREVSVPYASVQSVEQYTGTVGDPVAYVMQDQALVLYPTPSTARAYTLYYVPFIADLSDSNTTNWLLDRSPNVYVVAACLEAALYLRDSEMAGAYEGRYKQALDAMFQASERQRMPSNTPLVARVHRTVGRRC